MDWIQGNKFAEMADFTFSPPVKFMDDYYDLANTLDENKLKSRNVVFTTPFYAKELMDNIGQVDNEFIVITHNGDNEVNNQGVGYMDGRGNYIRTDHFSIPSNVVKWYATNVNLIHGKVEAIPSGLENDRWRPELRKKERLLEKQEEPRNIRNLVYIDFSTTWNSAERGRIYNLLEAKPWVTAFRDGANYERFLDNVYNHNFVVCPRGNGIATHREWETLYLGSIPIQKRNYNNQFFKQLPICFVDDWSEITESFLNSEYDRISNISWNKEILTFEYWKNKIINTL